MIRRHLPRRLRGKQECTAASLTHSAQLSDGPIEILEAEICGEHESPLCIAQPIRYPGVDRLEGIPAERWIFDRARQRVSGSADDILDIDPLFVHPGQALAYVGERCMHVRPRVPDLGAPTRIVQITHTRGYDAIDRHPLLSGHSSQ